MKINDLRLLLYYYYYPVVGVQEAVKRLRKSRNKLRLQNKALQTQLERTLAWCEELRLQVNLCFDRIVVETVLFTGWLCLLL